jgi:recombination protein RecA
MAGLDWETCMTMNTTWGYKSFDDKWKSTTTLLQYLIDLASTDNIVEKSGAWYAYEGERIGQGRENAKDYLRDHPEIAASIARRVLEKYGVVKPSPVQAVPDVETEEKRARVKAVK